MATKDSSIAGKILYGFLFVAVLPVLLLVWASMTEKSVPLPMFRSLTAGLIIASCGAIAMILGMVDIYRYGHGLPMNAYPPARFVTEGIYRFLGHPIYAGFSFLCIGVSILAGSSSGFWLVSPTVILGCVALFEGYEKHAMHKRFGRTTTKHLIRLPPPETTAPTPAERISAYTLVIIPWLLLCQAGRVIGTAQDKTVSLDFEAELSVYEWAEPVYLSRYLLILLVPLTVKSAWDLRAFMIFGLVSTGFAVLLFIAFPFAVLSRPFAPQNFFGQLLIWDQALNSRALAFLASHIVWIVLAAQIHAKVRPSWKIFFFGWALLIIAGGIAAGTHTIPDILTGVVIFLLAINIRRVWERLRLVTERIANSWKEWRFGPIRFINHGVYAYLGTFIWLSIVGTLLGPSYVKSIMIIAASVVITSAVSAQWIEGSARLLRPYGWFGGVLGAVIGAFIAQLVGGNTWLLLAAFCIGAPWLQAAGRLRCLIQGCCHGREATDDIGIRYVHPSSRVCRLSHLSGVPLHPTPLYSIIYNAVVAVIIARLWFAHASLSLIIGIYLVLTGLGRFVEESYRGEPQTAVIAGLRLYQLIAILTILAGIFVSMVGNTMNAPEPMLNWQAIVAAALFGLFTCFASSVDFPNSNKRFARLT